MPCAALHPPDTPQVHQHPPRKAGQDLVTFSECISNGSSCTSLFLESLFQMFEAFPRNKILTRAWTHIQISQYLSHCPQYQATKCYSLLSLTPTRI